MLQRLVSVKYKDILSSRTRVRELSVCQKSLITQAFLMAIIQLEASLFSQRHRFFYSLRTC